MPSLRSLFRGLRPTPAPSSAVQTDPSADAGEGELILVERREMLVMDPETAKAYVAAMAPAVA